MQNTWDFWYQRKTSEAHLLKIIHHTNVWSLIQSLMSHHWTIYHMKEGLWRNFNVGTSIFLELNYQRKMRGSPSHIKSAMCDTAGNSGHVPFAIVRKTKTLNAFLNAKVEDSSSVPFTFFISITSLDLSFIRIYPLLSTSVGYTPRFHAMRRAFIRSYWGLWTSGGLLRSAALGWAYTSIIYIYICL